MAEFSRLVLSGGGPRGFAILGALHYVDEHHSLDTIKEYWGTSVGSVICLLLVIGYTPMEAFQQLFILDNFAEPETFQFDPLVGLCPIEVFGEKIRKLLEKKLGSRANPTFFDLQQWFGKKLTIIGANVDKMCGENFSVTSHPLMPVIEAIEISCDLPWIFSRKKYRGEEYVDGGFINNYPVNLADDGQHFGLGICVLGTVGTSKNSYISWLYKLAHMPIMELYKERVSRLTNKFIHLEVTIDNLSLLEMAPDQKKKLAVFSSGYRQARDLFEWEFF
jgi:predicted acylesterase/phospholipase RssA